VPPGFGDGLGDGAPAWVATLPALATKFCARWDLTPDGDLLTGFVAVVLPVRRADGSQAVLKLTWLDAETRDEPRALKLWDGRGVVRLLDHDDEHGALLLERLDHTRPLTDAPIEVAVEVTGGLLRDLRIPAPPGFRRARTGDDLAARNSALGGPLPKRLLDAAVAFGRDLAVDADDTLVNEDLHYGNVLRGDRAPWLMIDPKPLSGDPEYCVLPLLWNRFTELAGPRGMRDRVHALVDISSLDAERVHGWAVARAVEAQLWSLDAGLPEFASVCGTLADWLMAEAL
jgi:streptomycin 6-kinase